MALGDALAVHIKRFVDSLGWEFEAIVPVPLGEKRMRERGYNQVALIAKPVSLALDSMYRPAALKRQRDTRSQVGLSAGERRDNVRNAFLADPNFVRGKSVLVMDDVATTGATLTSSAEALLHAGASQVYAITVARALPHHGLNLI
ncbi:MAG: hypothetical protein HFACDABA_01068 [Anaerolineales bacterium]|nr:hypothetical protein [Anaerolineales bacterium]